MPINVGDIYFVAYFGNGTANAAGGNPSNEGFAIFFKNAVAAGEVLKFTDGALQANGTSFGTTEQTVSFTIPAGGIAAGTVIEFPLSGTTATTVYANLSDGSRIAIGSITPTGNAGLSNSGDQLFAYQGTATSATVLAGIDVAGTSPITTGVTNTNNTYAPPAGVPFLDFPQGTNNVQISIDPTTATAAQLVNISNYTQSIATTTNPEASMIQIHSALSPSDTTPPTLSSSSPVDNATGVVASANIVLTFSEAVKAGSGNIILRPTTGGDVTINVTDTSQITFNGNQATINPTADLQGGMDYDVIIASGVITDTAGNAFAGIAQDALDFTTASATDTLPPTLSSSTPADNATDVAIGANIVLNFSEAVQAGSGNIILRPATGADITISVTDAAQVSFSGSQVTINPNADLRPGVAYDVIIASGVIVDTAANPFAGIAQDALDFTSSFTIPGGSQTSTFAIQDPGTFTLLAAATRTQTTGVGVTVSAATGPVNVDIEGTLNDTAGSRAIDYGTANIAGTITVGASGLVQSINQDTIRTQSVNGTINLNNQGQILATVTPFTPSLGGTNPGTDFAITYNVAKGTAGAPATDYASGGTITNGAVGNTSALIRSDNGDAIRLGSHETLINYGTINGNGPVDDASTNNGFNSSGNTSTAQTYDVSRGVRINQSGATAVDIENYGTITGAQHGMDTGQTNVTNVVVNNYAGGQIIGRNGSGVGSDTTGAAVNTFTVNNYGLIRGDRNAGTHYDRAGYVTTDSDGDGVDIDGGATINNFTGGQILATGASGFDSNGRANASEGISIGGGAITNDGAIQGADAGIVVNNDSVASRSGVTATTITNQIHGTITGQASYAIRLENKTGTAADNDSITNYGAITGNGAIPDPNAIVLRQDGAFDPNSAGTLDGTTYGATGNARFVKGDGAAIQMGEGNDTLANYGTITGNSGRAINLEGGSDALTLYSGSGITGLIDGGAGIDTLVLKLDDRPGSGGGATGNNSGATAGALASVVQFEALDVAGGNWTIGDSQSYANGVTIENGAILSLGTGAALAGAVTDNGLLKNLGPGTITLANLISGAGLVEQAGSGTLVLSNAANSYSGGTTLSAGTLDVATVGAAGSGAITFGAGAETLRVEAAATSGGAFANMIAGFAADGDTIDARGIGLATASYNVGTGVLTLTGTSTETFQIGTGYGAFTFNTADDGAGGTAVTLSSATPPSLSVTNVSVVEGDNGTTNLVFTITADAPAPAGGISFTAATADGTATTADGDYQGLSGTYSIAPGQNSTSVTVTVNGDRLIEPDETLILTISNPTNATIGAGAATGTITNDDFAGSFSLAGDQSGSEAAGALTFTVNRSGGSAGSATVSYAVTGSGGNAADAADFGGTLPSGTVTFLDGETSKAIMVTPTNDSVFEANETFTLTLSNPTAGTIATATATGTITNDDPPPNLTIGDVSVIEGDSGTKTLVFTVTSSVAATADGINVDYATANGTATAGSDYVATSGTLNIASGQTTGTISVTINGDTVFEGNETLFVNLTNPVNATVADSQAVGTVANDDPVPATVSLFSENFANFTAAGFAPSPAAGQLDSDIWRVVGLSDNPTNPAYGFTGAAGTDFGRGIITGSADPTPAGVYSPSANHALVVQPTGAELDSNGFIEARIQNVSGAAATSFDVAFDWAYRNSGDRSSNMQLSYSTDGTTFIAVSAANFSTPSTKDATVAGTFTNTHETVTLSNLVVGDGGFLYLRWTHVTSTGSNNRDEVGIDNVDVTAHLSTVVTANAADISVAEGNSGTTEAIFTISRTNGTGTASVDYATANGTAIAGIDYVAKSGTVTFAEGETSKTVTVLVNGDTAHESDETFFLNLTNPVGFALPDAQARATIANDDGGPVAIYDIQGAAIVSSFAGQTVATHGVVTAVDTTGFYLQDPTGDANDATSDGIFVFTSTAPTVAVGDDISLTGTVQEFVGSTAGSASTTELVNPTGITVLSTGNPLPAPILIATDGTGRAPPSEVIDDDGLTSYNPATDGFDFYESLEGMRVTIQTPRVVSNTNSFGETFVVASNGLGATGLNSRSGNTISAGDNNPETIVITRDAGVFGSYVANHSQGDVLGNVTGVLNYQFAMYELIVTAPVTTTTHVTLMRETTSLTGDAGHLSYATFNVENLAPVPDSTVAARNTQAKVDAAFAAHATEIVTALHSPDIIGLQEIQDADGIGTGTDYSGLATAAKLIAAIIAAGGPAYQYVEIAPSANNSTGGEPNGNIHNGFLYNPERVSYVEGSAHLLQDPAYNNTRRPLLADFVFNGQTFTAADLHSTSRGGSDPLFGADQPPTQAGDSARTAQGQALQTYITSVQNGDPNHMFIVNGDFNGYYYEGGLRALESTNGGTGSLNNLIDLLPVEERYSYYFGGYYQMFDNILVSANLYAGAQTDVVHYNAGFTDGLSATDHDQTVATIGLARSSGPATAVADHFTTTEAAFFRGTILANDTGGGAGLVVASVNSVAPGGTMTLASGAQLVVHADGTFTYNPDGAFSSLAAGGTATDSFSYTLAGGSTATATITITGITNAAPTSGNDTLAGTPGNDSFDLSAGGDDSASGGAGNDGFFFGAAFTATDHIDGGSGTNDQIGLQGDYTGGNALTLGVNTITGIEALVVLPGFSYNITTNDANVAAGGLLNVQATQLAAGQSLTFNGSAETDGRFMIFGGNGNDHFTGGAGNDGFYFGPGGFNSSDIIDGGAGINDQLGLDGDYTITLGGNVTNVEVLALIHGPTGTPNHFNITSGNAFVAASQTMTIFGLQVETSIVFDGSGELDGAFRIYGGLAGDTLGGSTGNDWLFGGGGGDTLTGGLGSDIFYYDNVAQSTSTGFDRIVGFDDNADTIDLPFAVTGFGAPGSGNLSTASFDSDLQGAFAGLTAHQAGLFTATGGDMSGRTFLVIDADGNAGYQAGSDYVIEIVSPMTPIDQPAMFV